MSENLDHFEELNNLKSTIYEISKLAALINETQDEETRSILAYIIEEKAC